jgi:hypothetical protein
LPTESLETHCHTKLSLRRPLEMDEWPEQEPLRTHPPECVTTGAPTPRVTCPAFVAPQYNTAKDSKPADSNPLKRCSIQT